MAIKPVSRLRTLIERIAAQSLPVEIPTIRDALVDLHIQDRIIFYPDNEMNPEELRGVYYQYRVRSGVYADPENISLIIYCARLSIPWQRIICCKELVHIFDTDFETTDLAEEIDGLIDRLLGPFSTEDISVYDIMAAKDRLALYQCLPLLFPESERIKYKELLIRNAVTIESIAKAACLPETFVRLLMSDEWPSLAEAFEC